MIVLGVALVIVALLLGGFVAFGGSDTANETLVSAFGVDITTTAFVVFLAGAATLLVLVVGLGLIRAGSTRHARTRAELSRLRRIEAEHAARQEPSRAAAGSGAVHDRAGQPESEWPSPPTRPFERVEHDADTQSRFVKRDPEPREEPEAVTTVLPAPMTAADTTRDSGSTVAGTSDGERDSGRL